MINMKRMEEQLVLHEGLKLQAYLDTEDNWTLGVGYNVTGRGLDFMERVIGRKLRMPLAEVRITREEALLVLHADLERVEKAVRVHFPEYDTLLNEVRQRVVCDMVFNMGTSIRGFVKCIAAVKAQNWSAAARELWKSKWSSQVGDGPGKKYDRADRLTNMLLTGLDFVS